MALLERIATLVRANLNELAERAEDPVTLMKQVVLDMENQLMQVKTQVAISLADQHLLEKKRVENRAKIDEFDRKAELALSKGVEQLARAALERRLSFEQLAPAFDQQVSDHQTEVENLKRAFSTLEGKLAEARAKGEMLMAQQRRARAVGRAVEAAAAFGSHAIEGQLNRAENQIFHEELVSQAQANPTAQLERLMKEEKIDRMLEELKARKAGRAAAAD